MNTFLNADEKYRILFDSIDEGFCIIEMIFDEHNKPIDYRFLEINASFERQTGLYNAIGKRMREFAPNHEDHWFEIYGKIALTGESNRFENRAEQLHRWYDVYAFRFGDPKNLQVAILFNDITKRKETEEQLQIANKELESFSYSVSHDLRSPLRALSGYSRIMSEDYMSALDDNGKGLLKSIEENALKMGLMIDDLLEFSRLGRKEIQKNNVDMNSIVEQCIRDINSSAQHNAEIKINPLIPATGDSNLLSHVWSNLITNAIKYSGKKEKPQIEIDSVKEGDQVTYSVKDNGVGFNMAYSDKLFGVFQRLHRKEEFDGTGIGLAIVNRIVKKHGGNVWAEAKPNEGATFYFSLK